MNEICMKEIPEDFLVTEIPIPNFNDTLSCYN